MAVSGRAIVNLLFGILVIGLLVGVGYGVYDAGVQQGILQAGRLPAGAAVPYGYGYGYHPGFFGFGIFGFLFPLLFIFLIFGLIRAAFRGGRGGWGRHGWGPGWGPGGPGSESRTWQGWQDEREQRIADVHRKLHESEGSPTGSGGGGTSPGAPAAD
jgi:hypothetical protein